MRFRFDKLVLGAAVCWLLPSASASAHVQVTPFDKSANNINALFDDFNFPEHSTAIVQYGEDTRGVIAAVQIKQSSGSRLADFNCLEALTENSPFYGFGKSGCSASIKNAIFTKNSFRRPSIKQKLSIEKQLDEAYLVHLIPRGLAYSAPSAFSVAELDQADNMRKIVLKADSPADRFAEAKECLFKLSSNWSKYLTENPNVSREQILIHAKVIEAELNLEQIK